VLLLLVTNWSSHQEERFTNDWHHPLFVCSAVAAVWHNSGTTNAWDAKYKPNVTVSKLVLRSRLEFTTLARRLCLVWPAVGNVEFLPCWIGQALIWTFDGQHVRRQVRASIRFQSNNFCHHNSKTNLHCIQALNPLHQPICSSDPLDRRHIGACTLNEWTQHVQHPFPSLQ
jgi:hypothetical protein